MADEKKGFTLGDLIKNTADDIRKARAETPENAVMQFEKCELELAVTVSGEAGASIRFWLVDAKTNVKGEYVSKVKLSFGPIKGKDGTIFVAESDDAEDKDFAEDQKELAKH
jgi:hypothetical protein